ncbi:MAG: flagellar basal body P-ring formation chaperone FlgA [Pseudomonadota bacterium]
MKTSSCNFRHCLTLAYLTVTAAGLLTSTVVHAAHPLDEIAEVARQFIDETHPATQDTRREIEVRPLDPRLQLATCDQPLQAFSPGSQRGGGTLTVGVRCNGSSPWKIYVSARVKLFRPVAVLTRPLPKDAPVQPSDIELREVDVNNLTRGFFTRPADLSGMTAKRPLNSGEVLTPNNLQAPKAVSKGTRVLIRAQGSALDVVMMGEAMRDGGIGERIPVRNLSSGRIVEAVIHAPGEVFVLF